MMLAGQKPDTFRHSYPYLIDIIAENRNIVKKAFQEFRFHSSRAAAFSKRLVFNDSYVLFLQKGEFGFSFNFGPGQVEE